MSGVRQLSVWAALGLWAAVVTAAAFYGVWHGYGGRGFAVTLGVLAFFLATQLLLAAGNLSVRVTKIQTVPKAGVISATNLSLAKSKQKFCREDRPSQNQEFPVIAGIFLG